MGRMYVYKYVSQCSPARRVRLENCLPRAVSHSPGARSSSPEVASSAGKLGLAASCERSSLRGLPAPVCSRHRNGYAKVCQGISYLFSSKYCVQSENRGSTTVPVEKANQHALAFPRFLVTYEAREAVLLVSRTRQRDDDSPPQIMYPGMFQFLTSDRFWRISSRKLLQTVRVKLGTSGCASLRTRCFFFVLNKLFLEGIYENFSLTDGFDLDLYLH